MKNFFIYSGRIYYGLIGVFVLALFLTVAFLKPAFLFGSSMTSEAMAQSVDWWDEAWCHRIKLTFNNSAANEDLDNFPVLVKFTKNDVSRFDYAKAKSDGSDLRFIYQKSDGMYQVLAYEIERYDAQGESFIWVKVPKISALSSNDFIWLYFGNPNALNDGNGLNKTAVWDDNFKMVQHLQEITGTHFDSTKNHNNTVAIKVADQGGAVGKINGADNFEYDNQNNLKVADNNSLNMSNEVTLEAWVKLESLPLNSMILDKGKKTLTNVGGKTVVSLERNYAMLVKDSGELTFNFYNQNWQGATTTGLGLVPNEWYYLAATFSNDTNSLKLYGNGVEKLSTSNSADMLVDSGNLYMGMDFEQWASNYFDGLMDELRVSSVARSGAWIEAQYKSMNNDFLTYSETETLPRCLDCIDPANWWDANWSYRRKLNFDSLDIKEDLVDFPVLIKLVDNLGGSRIDYIKVQDQGQDLRFVDADNQTVLAHDIEEWNNQGDSYIWVKVRGINKLSVDDFIYMYYGNPDAGDGQNKEATWGNNYAGVWHLNEKPLNSGKHFDVSGKGNHGTFIDPNGSSNTSAGGQIAGAVDFKGADGDRVYIGDPSNGSLDFGRNSFSYSMWVYVESSNAAWDAVWNKGGSPCQASYANSTVSWDCGSVSAGGQGDISFKVMVGE